MQSEHRCTEQCPDDEGNPKPEALERNEAILSAYGGSIIKQFGTVNILCKYKDKKINCIFDVTGTAGPAILGLKACTALKLVSLHCTLGTNQLDQADPTNSFNAPAQNLGTCKKTVQEKLHQKSCTTGRAVTNHKETGAHGDVPRMF